MYFPLLPRKKKKKKKKKKGQVRSGQVRSGQVRSGQVRSGQVRSGQVRSGQVSGNDNFLDGLLDVIKDVHQVLVEFLLRDVWTYIDAVEEGGKRKADDLRGSTEKNADHH
jgi:CRISPR/Cas system-associated protein Csm6